MPWFTSTSTLKIIDSVAIVIAQAYQLARCRLASNASSTLRLIMERDELLAEVEWLKRELEILRGQRANLLPRKQPTYSSEQRLAIVQLMRQRGWSITIVAKRFVIHPQSIRKWVMTMENGDPTGSLFPKVRWNRIDDAVRWAVHELRRLCPEPEMGTRTIARHLIRAGIQISRRSVQRILHETPPPAPKKARKNRPPMNPPVGAEPHGLLTPDNRNDVWHMDLMNLKVLWIHFTVAAILDGATRRLLCLRVYRKKSGSQQLLRQVRKAVTRYGTPRHLITDHGGEFQMQFQKGLKALGIKHVRGPVRMPNFNGKIERLFRTLRIWQRSTWLLPNHQNLQKRLASFQLWYNQNRYHQSLDGLTPDEAWNDFEPDEPIPIRSANWPSHPHIRIQRNRFNDDAHLPVIKISVTRQAA
ncbi:MAG TPA: hypothetical protein DCM28_03505 [Phycisphaerales bacterium]|mgnify:CR=1 FL=1|nr:hypothetical protein [Phycisphaerales bacterium]HCD31841.1 hypothetical protein [Phycisphaerales bacterium]|tara:strand:+ start:45555 stop:46799 length:1245 start_codon:yes stop_codon:yes gene_type:complete